MFAPLMLAGWICIADLPANKDRGSIERHRPVRIKSLAELQTLSPDEFDAYIEGFAKQRNYDALEALCKANISYARTVYVSILDNKQAIRYCKSLQFGSVAWEHAFWGLSYHKKDTVIGYVKEVCQMNAVYARVKCYELCLKAGWDDLVERAKLDINDKTPMGYPFGYTLGTYARNYLRLLPEVQKRLRRN
jgi:hypothetical protein